LFAAKTKRASVTFVSRAGASVIATSGCTVSTVHEYVVTGLSFCAASTALTPNVCAPSRSAGAGVNVPGQLVKGPPSI
jgi:hypothetical protein